MNAQPDLLRIPLQQLQLSPRNARKTGGTNVEDLAASIAAHGLLQNLTAQPSANDPNTYEVVAGGRRLAALQRLQERGELPPTLAADGIPCRLITDDDVALEASTAENTLREAMHPADQFDAFRAMVEAGKPIADVAAHFGVTDLVVKQRLKLANVNPQLIEIYRQGDMTLEQLQALALTDNHEAQRQAWFTAQNDWERSPRDLRERLTRKEVESDSTLARFVGLDAYEAAGGPVRRDLFSSRGEAWLQDRALLEKLALDRLQAISDAEREKGWSWAEAHLHLNYSQLAEYPQHPDAREAQYTKEQLSRLGEIESLLEQLQMGGDEELTDEQQEAEIERLEAEAAEIEAQGTYPAEVMRTTGVLVYLDHGGIRVIRGRARPGQKVAASGEVKGTPKASSASEPAQKPKKAELSAAVLANLSAHRSEVARFHVARDPQLALALLVERLASHVGDNVDDRFGFQNPLRITGQAGRDVRQGIATDVHAALRRTDDLPAACHAKMPKGGKRLAWLIQQPQGDLLAMLASLVARTFDGISEFREGHEGVAALHEAIAFNMADHWSPTCDNFLGRIPAALVIQAVTEAKGKDAAAALAGLKKDALVAEAAKALAGTGWLPKPLRGSGYGTKPPASPAAKASSKIAAVPKKQPAKATKKPAKKPAKAAAKTKSKTIAKRQAAK